MLQSSDEGAARGLGRAVECSNFGERKSVRRAILAGAQAGKTIA